MTGKVDSELPPLEYKFLEKAENIQNLREPATKLSRNCWLLSLQTQLTVLYTLMRQATESNLTYTLSPYYNGHCLINKNILMPEKSRPEKVKNNLNTKLPSLVNKIQNNNPIVRALYHFILITLLYCVILIPLENYTKILLHT